MKNLRMTVKFNGGRTMTVIGRGDDRQARQEIIERVREQLRDETPSINTTKEINVDEVELIRSKSGESMDHGTMVFDVHRRTEEPYCDSNYGIPLESNRSRANGPVSYTEWE
ncbi:MAG: hypothetical protein ABEK50_04880 [bacterium]